MKIFVALARKQMGDLYHYTSFEALLSILQTGVLELSTGHGIMVEKKHASGKAYFASFTRSRFGGYHIKSGEASKYTAGMVLITVDGEALTNRYKFAPIDYWEQRGHTSKESEANKEFEERLLANKPQVPILKFIKRVDFIVPATLLMVRQTFGGKETRLAKNDREGNALGSIVLRLKTNKIPYAFYNSAGDWARKTGEVSYLAPKKVSVVGRAERWEVANKRTFQHLSDLVVCLTDLPYEKLSKTQKDICYQLNAYPQDASSVFNDYDNNRKPDAHPELRAAAQKLARVLQRKGWDIPQAAKFMSQKYRDYSDRERAERDKRDTEDLAEQFVKIYDGNFEPLANVHNDSRLLLYKEEFDYAERTCIEKFKKALEGSGANSKKLQQIVGDEQARDCVRALRKKLIDAGMKMEY